MEQVPMQSIYNPRTGIRTKLHWKKIPGRHLTKLQLKATGHGHILTLDYQAVLTSSENHKWAEKEFFDKYKEVLPSWVKSAEMQLYKGLRPVKSLKI